MTPVAACKPASNSLHSMISTDRSSRHALWPSAQASQLLPVPVGPQISKLYACDPIAATSWRTMPCRDRAPPSCRHPRRRPIGAAANFNRLMSLLFSRSMASRSTMSASLSSAERCNVDCWRCSSSALAMPVVPAPPGGHVLDA